VFREIALVVEQGVDPVEVATRLVEPGGRAHVLVWARAEESSWWDPWGSWSARLEELDAAADAARAALTARGIDARAEGALAPSDASLAELFSGDAVPADVLFLVGADPGVRARRWCVEALEARVAVGWAPASWGADEPRLFIPYTSKVQALPLGAFLKARVAPEAPVTFTRVGVGEVVADDPERARELTGWEGELRFEAISAQLTELPAALEHHLVGALAVLPSSATGAVGRAGEVELMAQLSARRGAPALLVPTRRGALPTTPTLDACDVVWPGSKGRFYVWSVDAWGRARPAELERVALVRGGEVVWRGIARRGRAEGGALEPGSTLGVAHDDKQVDPLERVEAFGRVLDPGTARVGLFDAAAGTEWLERAREGAPEREWWAVRMDDAAAPSALRGRVAGAQALIDAGAVLDDGHPDDLPDAARVIRLGRVARRLRAEGVQVDAVVGDPTCAERGHAWVRPEEVGELEERVEAAWEAPRAGGWPERMFELTGARQVGVASASLELENRAFRERLLAMIMTARERIAMQTYIFSEDPAGAEVARALGAAARRGVRVRLLVDSLWSQDGSLGMENATLRALAMGEVEVRRRWPVDLVGRGLEGLKRRDHRKLVVVDGRAAIVSGRNVGGAYLTGFDEVALTPESMFDQVPWLDASIEVTGEVVARVLEAFERAWVDSGGAREEGAVDAPPGGAPGWFVTHEGLRDAHTLDAQRELIDRARSTLWIVNTFPVQKELRSAMRDALERGVDVRVLMGNVRPLWGEPRTPFPGGAPRALATEIIHGRLTDLIRRGARVWEYAVDAAAVASWSDELGSVFPHVHAKVLCVDDEVLAVGSANLDISAAYWESEAILVLEDQDRASALGARLDELARAGSLLTPDDPRLGGSWWGAREVLSEYWPSILG
jgi:phosphatidylserine/phosphatidylglycerophosphate/cardiolipin synthase-like enzyme